MTGLGLGYVIELTLLENPQNQVLQDELASLPKKEVLYTDRIGSAYRIRTGDLLLEREVS